MRVVDLQNRGKLTPSGPSPGVPSLFRPSSAVLVQSSQQDYHMNTNTTETEIDVVALLADVEAFEAECAEVEDMLATVEYL